MRSLLLLLVVVGCGVQQNDIYDKTPVIVFRPENAPENLTTSEADIEIFADELEDIANNEGMEFPTKEVVYVFEDLTSVNQYTIGNCTVYADKNVIRIDIEYWANANDWNKRVLVWHEMGHCVLGRGHRNLWFQTALGTYDGGIVPSWPNESTYLPDGTTPNPNYRGNWALSLMSTYAVSGDKLELEYDYYVHELLHNTGVTQINAGTYASESK